MKSGYTKEKIKSRWESEREGESEMGEGRKRYIREGKGQQAQVRPHTTTEMFSSTLYYFENTHRNKHELK